ncbi:HAD-IIA family hydrolase [Paenibacillus sp. 1011MAR3C5]|uniref:HAD-IIA family hydrolase n=1 Tax=Paenibacillus sp. 1011MAR3C5 TaxID=1675787 RepID=UPI000E6BF3E0|nr:HAD-IIA family hydrolase [Paenibacillus sp. 1011MAR3C5]RJE89977.1 HAD-IIA family hydrolase [Paenibacillus sp. 1011MAR3C5]
MRSLHQYSAYIFDLDGTIYLGSDPIEGAVETIKRLQSLGKKLLFLTNKTIDSREAYLRKLNGFGLSITLDEILNPALVTIHYLKRHHPGDKAYVIGEDILKDELKDNGIAFADSPDETGVVVISWDRNFHYDHLDFAYQAIKRGASVIATHPDRTCPMPGGEIPDCGAMIGAIEGASGIKVEVVMGKPSSLTTETALDLLKVDAKDCLMTGDRLETDIRMGQQAGMGTALVLTGVTGADDWLGSDVRPTYVLQSVWEIGQAG